MEKLIVVLLIILIITVFIQFLFLKNIWKRLSQVEKKSVFLTAKLYLITRQFVRSLEEEGSQKNVLKIIKRYHLKELEDRYKKQSEKEW